MKKFLSNNWRTILLVIGCVFVLSNIVHKAMTRSNILNEYLESDIYVESDILDNIDGSKIAGDTSFIELDGIYGVIFLIGGGILLVVLITTIADKIAGGGDAKKKK